MAALERLAKVLSRSAALIAGLLLVYIAIHTIAEIVLRGVFGRSTIIHVEFVGYALASMTFLALAQTMRDGALVRVNVLLSFVSPRLRRILDVFCVIATASVVAFVTWYVWFDIQRSFVRGYETDSIVPLPQWIPRIGVFVGLVIFLFDLVVQALLIAIRGRRLPDSTTVIE